MPELNDPLAASQQCRGQSGTNPAGAFDGPQRRAVAPPEGDLAGGSQPDRPEPSGADHRCDGKHPTTPTRAFRTCTVSSQTPDELSDVSVRLEDCDQIFHVHRQSFEVFRQHIVFHGDHPYADRCPSGGRLLIHQTTCVSFNHATTVPLGTPYAAPNRVTKSSESSACSNQEAITMTKSDKNRKYWRC